MLDKKLQLKDGQKIALLGHDVVVTLSAERTSTEGADAVLAFVTDEANLRKHLEDLKAFATENKLTWVAYPKAKQLNTDLNRDIVREIANQHELDPVRQIAIDDIWSALRLKKL
jgi:hypothetical protein